MTVTGAKLSSLAAMTERRFFRLGELPSTVTEMRISFDASAKWWTQFEKYMLKVQRYSSEFEVNRKAFQQGIVAMCCMSDCWILWSVLPNHGKKGVTHQRLVDQVEVRLTELSEGDGYRTAWMALHRELRRMNPFGVSPVLVREMFARQDEHLRREGITCLLLEQLRSGDDATPHHAKANRAANRAYRRRKSSVS